MSASARFAPITAQLLARKGEAGPVPMGQPETGSSASGRSVLLERERESPGVLEIARFSDPPPTTRRRHSIALSVSDDEFEQLGLAAIKKRVNRQQLLRLAIDHYLGKLESEYRAECRCISRHTSCSDRALD